MIQQKLLKKNVNVGIFGLFGFIVMFMLEHVATQLFPWLSVAIPAFFKNVLKNQETQEGNSISLQCELSKAGVYVEWWKGHEMLRTGETYQLRKKDTTAELVIRKAHPEDSGVYRCVCGDQSTEAHIRVNGRQDCLLIMS